MMLALRPKIHSLETTHAYALRLANANGLRRIPGTLLERCVFRPIVTAHSEKGVTGDSEVVTGDSDLIVTDLGRRRNHRSRCRNRRSRSNRNGLCGQRGNHPCHGYPRALCAERRDAGGADCHAQHQGAVTAQVRLRALA